MYVLFGGGLLDCTGKYYDQMLGLAPTKEDAVIKLIKYYRQIHPCDLCTCQQSISQKYMKYIQRNSQRKCQCFPLKYRKMMIASDEIIEEKVFLSIEELRTDHVNMTNNKSNRQ